MEQPGAVSEAPDQHDRRVRRPPSPTLGRYLLIMTVLLLGGALAGQITHHVTVGPGWAAVTESCSREALARLPGPDQVLARVPLFDDCRAYVEHRLALFAVAGAALLFAAAVAVSLLLPAILLRRLGPRRPVPPPIQARAAGIAAELGVRTAPTVELGPWWLKEPFTVRAQGATRIVLPLGVRRAAHLDAVLRHETAHVAAGDVTLVWLSRGLLHALPVVMAAPLVLGAFVDAAYVARAALLWVAGLLLARAVTRDRELEADARAARAGSAEALLALFTRAPGAARGRLLALHPAPARRAAVVADPAWSAGTPVTVAAVAAALAVNVWTSGTSIGLSAFVGTPLQPYPSLVAGLIAGALLALTWGHPPRTALPGLLAGAAIGLLVSLDQRIPTNVLAGDWPDVIVVPLILAGAAGLLTAIRPSPVAGAIVFGGALWIGFDVAARAQVTEGLALLWTSGFAGGWLLPGAVFVAAVAVVLGIRRPSAAVTGVLAGLAALAVRWLAPLPALDLYPEAQRDWWAAAAAGFTLVAALLLTRPADGLVAGPVAAVTVSAGVLLRYLPDWDDPLAAARVYLSRPLAMLLLLTLAVGVLAGSLPSRPAPRRPWLTAAGLALAACAVVGAVLAGGDAFLVR